MKKVTTSSSTVILGNVPSSNPAHILQATASPPPHASSLPHHYHLLESTAHSQPQILTSAEKAEMMRQRFPDQQLTESGIYNTTESIHTTRKAKETSPNPKALALYPRRKPHRHNMPDRTTPQDYNLLIHGTQCVSAGGGDKKTAPGYSSLTTKPKPRRQPHRYDIPDRTTSQDYNFLRCKPLDVGVKGSETEETTPSYSSLAIEAQTQGAEIQSQDKVALTSTEPLWSKTPNLPRGVEKRYEISDSALKKVTAHSSERKINLPNSNKSAGPSSTQQSTDSSTMSAEILSPRHAIKIAQLRAKMNASHMSEGKQQSVLEKTLSSIGSKSQLHEDAIALESALAYTKNVGPLSEKELQNLTLKLSKTSFEHLMKRIPPPPPFKSKT